MGNGVEVGLDFRRSQRATPFQKSGGSDCTTLVACDNRKALVFFKGQRRLPSALRVGLLTGDFGRGRSLGFVVERSAASTCGGPARRDARWRVMANDKGGGDPTG